MSTHRFKTAAASAALMGLIAGPLAPAAFAPTALANSGHSYANIAHAGQTSKNRDVVLPYGKSTIVELPAQIMDVIVSNPEIVESIIHTEHRVMLVGRKPGQANVHFYSRDGQELLSLNIRVERDLSQLKSLIDQHIPGNNIEVQAVNNNIILSGPVASLADSQLVEELADLWFDEDTGAKNKGKIVNLMALEGRDQVMLKVRIVEMQRSVTKQMGINLSGVAQLGDSTVSLVSNAALATGAGLAGDLDFVNTTGGAIQSIGSAFTALERVGLVRTKAETNLVALSGETANFQSGGEFPLLSNVFIDQFGQAQRSFTFKPYGVSLGFTPVVLSEGKISLNISTEVSEPTNENSFESDGGEILGIRTRKANSVVELPAGKSLVIAGLIRDEARGAVDGVPGAKNLPGVGALFRNRDDVNTQTELVIIVTPYLVDSTHPDNLTTPLDGFMPPGDREAVLLGRLNKVYAAPGSSAPGRRLQGPVGHAVD